MGGEGLVLHHKDHDPDLCLVSYHLQLDKKHPSVAGRDHNSVLLHCVYFTCPPNVGCVLCLSSWSLNNPAPYAVNPLPPPQKPTHAVALSLSHRLQTTNKLPSWFCFLFLSLVAALWRHNVKQRVPEPMALSINNARSMSLLSFLFFFLHPRGVGWI